MAAGVCLAAAGVLAACSVTTHDPMPSFPGSAGATEWRADATGPTGFGDTDGIHETPDALFDALMFSLLYPLGTPPDDGSGTLTPHVE